MKKSEGVFWKEIKSLKKESVLIFYQKLGEGGVLRQFSFFQISPLGAQDHTLFSENARLFYSSWKIQSK